MSDRCRILWIQSDRFDRKPNKSPLLEMSDRLGRAGYEVYIVTGYDKEKYIPERICANMVYLPAIDLPLIFRASLMLNSLIWVLLRGAKRDIVIVNPECLWIVPILSALGFGNIHLDIRTLPLTQNRALKKRLDNWLFWTVPMKYLRGRVKGYSFITKRLKEAVEHEFSTRFDDYVLWSSGVNIERFRPGKKGDGEEGKFTLFYHGSIYAHRGLEEIVEAVETLEEPYRSGVRLVIVGVGGGLGKLQQISNSSGRPSIVEYRGYVPHEKIAAEIRRADCCICPLPNLLQWNVSSPLKVLEYLASGKPVIITPIPAHTDVLKDEKFVVWTESSGVADFQKAIIEAYRNRKSLSKAAESAPGFVAARFDWDILAKKLDHYLTSSFPCRSVL